MDITDQHIERARNLIHLKRFDQAIVELQKAKQNYFKAMIQNDH